MLQLTTNRGVGSVTSGSGGSTDTPNPIQDADSNPGHGGDQQHDPDGGRLWHLGGVGGSLLERPNPYIFWYTPETRPYVAPGNRWTLELEDAPADSITASGTVWFEEHG